MDEKIVPLASDLAPGDHKSRDFNFSEYDILKINSINDPHFGLFYKKLWVEFGAKGELETKEVLEKRFSWPKKNGLQYEMIGILRHDKFIAVRDHSVIIPEDKSKDAIVHLSHVLITESSRGSGLAGWMRSFPLQFARQYVGSSQNITLVCEMEPQSEKYPERIVRLKSYTKAGFLMVDPSRINYLQPDFSPPTDIDKKGGPTPLPLSLVVRRVGREKHSSFSGSELKNIVSSLYKMYGSAFREQDMKSVIQTLEKYPKDNAIINLIPPWSGGRFK